jgi:hypothetical protein
VLRAIVDDVFRDRSDLPRWRRSAVDTKIVSYIVSTSYNLPSQYLSMRIPSLPNFVRTFYAFSNATFHRATPAPFSLSATRPGVALRASMPTIPFIGSLFHTAETRNMTHPVQKSDDEWRMQLNKGTCIPGQTTSARKTTTTIGLTHIQ